MNQTSIDPGATLGVFGGGQLGRMFTQAAQRLGYRVIVFTDEVDSPASQVAHDTIQADYLDLKAVRSFAERVDVVTLEFENIAVEAIHRASEFTLVRPGIKVLSVAQHRIREKSTLAQAGFPVTPFREICSINEILPAVEHFGWPLVLKTTTWGYDGKGQRKVSSQVEANDALEMLGPEPVIAEKWIPYSAEVSVVVARSPSGDLATFPMFTNAHHNHILDVTTCPPVGMLRSIEPRAIEIAEGVAERLELEGILCVEFFVTEDYSLLINEIAPRPHNSGHLTIEAARTSQFEQQVRAICNLPLGDTRLIQPAAMANLLGDVWGDDQPRYREALAESACYLHLYGKHAPRPGRKMGHITVLDQSPEAASERAIAIRGKMRSKEPSLFR
jgi:5-(carboxyamino)imidazole ribonucleotide synthase